MTLLRESFSRLHSLYISEFDLSHA
jgi:hypothetical protein